MEIAPRIRRIGNGVINSYLIEEGGQVAIVDAGLPTYWGDLPRELAAIGRSLDDVRVLLLTHAHPDHIGFAERIRREAGVPVGVHELDAALARGEVKNPSPGLGAFKMRPVPTLSFLLFSVLHGALRIPPIVEVFTFEDGAVLDLPGEPRVIHVPGHTPGSAALHAPSLGALFTGDAIATRSVLTGSTGPQLAPFGADYPQALASLDRLEGIQARILLPGHGDPWTIGVDEAVRRVRTVEAVAGH